MFGGLIQVEVRGKEGVVLAVVWLGRGRSRPMNAYCLLRKIIFEFPSPFLTAMRIKLQTLPPLKSLKAWFQIPSTLSLEYSTIDDLKLCLPVTDTSEHHDLVLVLDDFELLGDTTLSVLREGDLVWYVCNLLSSYSL